MRRIECYTRRTLERAGWPLAQHALISFRDPGQPLVSALCMSRLDLVLHDCAADAGLVGPTRDDAFAIRRFVEALPPDQHLAVQCESGKGRSVACAAALLRKEGDEDRARLLLRMGTHNRTLYRLLCQELELDMPAEPLMALAVRVKYPLDRAEAFFLSLLRQRYSNWRCTLIFDGPDFRMLPGRLFQDKRMSWVVTAEQRGLWGHPYRQLGIDRCLEQGAEYVGLNNDDNYLTPGYLEQMVGALQERKADLVMCQTLHAYDAWSVTPSTPVAGCADVGNWLASADLIRKVPWEGEDFEADGRFVERLARTAGRCIEVRRPLLVKN